MCGSQRSDGCGCSESGGNDMGNPTNYNCMLIAALIWYFGTVYGIVRGEVGSHKLYERWAPKCLTKEHINLCFAVSLSHLQPLKEERRNFLESLVTDGGIWRHHFILRSRHTGTRWKNLSFPRAKTSKSVILLENLCYTYSGRQEEPSALKYVT
jgi:hypothetical protein